MLDKIDRKILKMLDANSRTPNTVIAKRANISKQLLKYRIDRLIEKGIIRKFYAVINGVTLGYIYLRIYLRFQKLNIEKETELIKRIRNNPYVTWVVKCRGTWDLVVSIYAKDTHHFTNNYQTIVQEFQGNILSKKIVLMNNVMFSTRDYIGKSEGSVGAVYGGVTKHLAIDKLDHNILIELSRDSRIRIVSLASRVKANPDTVKSRIERMEKSGIIKGYKLEIDYVKLGFLFYILSLNLSNTSEKARKKMESYCKAHPNLVYLVNLLGDHEVDLEVEVESQEQLDEFIRDLRNSFFDIIRDMEVNQITNQYKLNYYPFIQLSSTN